MFLLDTDTYTHLFFARPEVVSNVTRANGAGEAVGITIITKMEILRGRIEAMLKADTRVRFLTMQRQFGLAEDALQRIEVIPLNDVAIDHFERLSSIRGLRRMGRADLLIASIVLARDATLATRNTRHCRLIPNLNHVNWVD
jgi:tRNA(fMet)-specific endonuclease VapC